MDTVRSAVDQAVDKLSSSHRLKDRVAIVTGASSGIGRAICLAYAREGAKIVVSDLVPTSRNPAEADATTVEAVQKLGGSAEFIQADVSSASSIDALVEAVAKKYGRLDIMVNNAGIAAEAGQPLPIWEMGDEVWDRTMSINCNGVFYGIRAAARQMVKQDPLPNGDRGWIINLASVFGLIAPTHAAAYGSSKHLVMGLTRCAAMDLAPFRVHCNSINPGYTQSAFTTNVLKDPEARKAIAEKHPFRGLGTPEDAAGIAVFLASDDAKWVTGQGIVSDGGYAAQ